MATIRKRGNLQWQAIVKRRGYPLTSRTFETKKDAEAWARAAERDMDLGQFLPNRDAERTLLHELLERYRRDVLPSKRGAHFGTSLRVLDDRLGRYSLAAITSKVLITHLSQPLIRAGRSVQPPDPARVAPWPRTKSSFSLA